MPLVFVHEPMVTLRTAYNQTPPTTQPAAHMRLEQYLGLVKQVLTDNLSEAYWVIAEIAELKPSPKGYYHLTLVEKRDDSLVAKVTAVMWRTTAQSVLPRFRVATGKDIAPGMTVLVQVSVDFHAQFGLQLKIADIDASYTLGDMARKRREILERLEREGHIDRNKAIRFPLVPLRIAIISSKAAAGYEDFVHQIDGNIHGYRFRHTLFQSLVQGNGAEAELVVALQRVALSPLAFDVVVIIRGGGSSVDLSCFDSYAVGAAIANLALPVITGIGHERDDSVADICAHTRVKTPTAAAAHLISAVRAFEERLEWSKDRIVHEADRYLCSEQLRLDVAARTIAQKATYAAEAEGRKLDLAASSVKSGVVRVIERQAAKLDSIETATRLLDPSNVLRRGYSITLHEGRAVLSAREVKQGGKLTTRLYDGVIESDVATVRHTEDS